MYPLVEVPNKFNKPFNGFDKKEAQAYFEWFMKIKDERIATLEMKLQQYDKTWVNGYDKTSLIGLFEWFKINVNARNMTQQEFKEFSDQLSSTPLLANVIEVSNNTFTKETVSICFDVAIYFGETLRRNINGLSWTYKVNSKKYVEYAQPLIVSSSHSVDVNPRRLIEVCAEKVIDRTEKENEFENLYNVWTNVFK